MSRLRSAASARSSATGVSVRSGRTNRTTGTNKVTSTKLTTKSGTVFEYLCAPCSRENSTIEATNFCQDCLENLCENCVKQHLKFTSMKDHIILGKSDRRLVDDATAVRKPSPLECPMHPGKLVDMYCADHDYVWCGACIAVNHRTCNSTMLLPDAAKGVSTTEEYKEVKENIRKVKKDILTLKKKSDRSLIMIEKQKNTAMKKITAYRKRVDKIFDDIEKNTVAELERACNTGVHQMQEDIKMYEDIIGVLDFVSGIMIAPKAGQEGENEVFVGIKRAKQKIKEGERVLAYVKHTLKSEPIQFVSDDRIISWCKSLNVFGTFSFQTKVYIGEFLEKYFVKMPEDIRDCDIFGCRFLNDDRLLLTDWDNKCIKLLDEAFQITDFIAVGGCPNDVCCLNPHEAVVTLPMQKTVQFVQLHPKMSLKHMFKTEESCRGLAFNDGQLFIVCGGFKGEGNGKVNVYSTTGDLLRVIDKNNSGQQIFSCPIAIEIVADGSLLHVTDGHRGIVTMTQQNDVISVVADKECIWPCGICLDRNDNAMICSGQSNTVIQVSGVKKLASVLSQADGLKRPHSICYDPNNMRMVLTMNKSNYIFVYKLTCPDIIQIAEGATIHLEKETAKMSTPVDKVVDGPENKKEISDKVIEPLPEIPEIDGFTGQMTAAELKTTNSGRKSAMKKTDQADSKRVKQTTPRNSVSRLSGQEQERGRTVAKQRAGRTQPRERSSSKESVRINEKMTVNASDDRATSGSRLGLTMKTPNKTGPASRAGARSRLDSAADLKTTNSGRNSAMTKTVKVVNSRVKQTTQRNSASQLSDQEPQRESTAEQQREGRAQSRERSNDRIRITEKRTVSADRAAAGSRLSSVTKTGNKNESASRAGAGSSLNSRRKNTLQ